MSLGKIIAIEGIDASGKGTQANKVIEYINSTGRNAILYNFPRYNTPVGKQIARYLTGEFGGINQVPYELICIAFGADRAAVSSEINDHVNNGDFVILDRYTYSNVFTAAKLPKEKWMDFIDWVENMEFENLGVIPPDCNFYLYIDPKLAMKRILNRGKRKYQSNKNDIHETDRILLKNTSDCYTQIANNKNNWFLINQMNKEGNQLSEDEVFKLIKGKLDILLNEWNI